MVEGVGSDLEAAGGTADTPNIGDGAPWVAYGNPIDNDFFSARMGCKVYQPVYGIDLTALCIKKP
jgi:hypothetical protein